MNLVVFKYPYFFAYYCKIVKIRSKHFDSEYSKSKYLNAKCPHVIIVQYVNKI